MNTRRRRHSDREAGFTLIEMLIALILMVGILAALATVTSQWLPNWNRGFAHVQRTEVFGLGLERLVADLSAAEFVTASRKAKRPLFEGDELAVQFVRTAIGPNTRPGLEVVRISTMSDDRGVALVRARTPFVPLPENGKIRDLSNFSDPVVLMRAPYRAIFSYAGPDHAWQNSWHDADQLPIAIRVLVRDAATQRTLAVSTATILRVNAPAECARARVAKDCIYPPANAAPNVSPNLDK
jgi:general secretion pathway protein J